MFCVMIGAMPGPGSSEGYPGVHVAIERFDPRRGDVEHLDAARTRRRVRARHGRCSGLFALNGDLGP